MTDPDFRELEASMTGALARLGQYLEESRSGATPVVRLEPIGKIAARLDLDRRIRNGGLAGSALQDFLATYLDATTRMHHPGAMAHQVAVPHLSGALGAFVDGFTNNPMAIYEMGPAAVAIEFAVVNWMLEKAGWRPAPWPGEESDSRSWGAGVLTHGGSLANLTALVAARSRLAPSVWEQGNPARLAVFASPHAHYATARAVGILGLGRRAILPLAVDHLGKIAPDRLESTYRSAIDDGWLPMALVASSCSTPVGLFDPLRPIGDFCRDRNLWLHVDGAHGASALLSHKTRHHLDGLDRADSLVWDAHKLLRTPSLCAAVLVREAANLERAFEQQASYLFHDKQQPGIDLISRTIECTKAGLGLRLFTVLAALGEAKLAAHVEHLFATTRAAYTIVAARPGFSCPVEPEANILCFRYGSDDRLQMRLRDRLLEEGRFHISSTEYMAKRYLRLCLMNPATDTRVVKALVERIELLAAEEQADAPTLDPGGRRPPA